MLYAILTLTAVATVVNGSPKVVVAALLVYTFGIGLCWPMLESLVAIGVPDPHDLSRRMAAYNVVWAGTAALTIAVNGTIIEYWPVGVFVITGLMHGLSAVLLILAPPREVEQSTRNAIGSPPAHLEPEPELLRVRTVALWLSRISVPASYALVYSLSALLPSLGRIKELPTWAATLVGGAGVANSGAGRRFSSSASTPGGTPGLGPCSSQPGSCCWHSPWWLGSRRG